MSEGIKLRGLIVDGSPDKVEKVQAAFEGLGGKVLSASNNAQDVYELVTDGLVSPDQLDVAFIDSDLGNSVFEGIDIVKSLVHRSLVRGVYGPPPRRDFATKPNPNKIVTVGLSLDPVWAHAIGSYSDGLRDSLAVDWNAPGLNMPAIVGEVIRLKDLA